MTRRIWILRAGILAILSVVPACSLRSDPAEPPAAREADPQYILRAMGGQGAAGCSSHQIESYRGIYARLDTNGDGQLTRQEFVEDGVYMTPEARAGMFRAMDRDWDDVVTEREYVENRIITDEAKEIFAELDADGDRAVTRKEFVDYSMIKDEQKAESAFQAFDSNRDGTLGMIEYLRVWGDIARDGEGERLNSREPVNIFASSAV